MLARARNRLVASSSYLVRKLLLTVGAGQVVVLLVEGQVSTEARAPLEPPSALCGRKYLAINIVSVKFMFKLGEFHKNVD